MTSLVVLPLSLVLAAPAADDAFEVRVDPRVELVTAVFRLAGNPEFTMAVSRSPYSEEFDARFAEFADHPAVEAARRLRAERGIGYDAPATLAVHLTDLESLGERVPFDLPPARLDPRWDAESARAFVETLGAFVEETGFAAWLEAHEDLSAAVEERLRAFLAPRLHAEWFPEFFGGPPKGRCVVVPSLLQGGHNYGCSVRLEDGSEELWPCIGLWSWDDDGLPVFDDVALGIVAHELSHAWVNPIVDAHAGLLDPPGERAFPIVRRGLTNRSYATGRIVTYETVVRAAVIRWRLAHEGRAAAARQVESDRREGFSWTGGLAERLTAYEEDRAAYPDLSAFVPEIERFLGELADGAERAAARGDVPAGEAPRVASLSPADGATDVPPGAGTLRIEFDRPMEPGMSMMILSDLPFPKVTGKPSWDAAGKALTVPVTFEAGRAYGYSLNRPGGGGSFRSRDG
ncbi:MAG: DUF4932 domain-containing protein, partial [Planctomycetota bacterium JB042]